MSSVGKPEPGSRSFLEGAGAMHFFKMNPEPEPEPLNLFNGSQS